MTGRHAGTPDLAGLSLADQATGCRDEILAFMATRASRPILWTPAEVLGDAQAALIEAYGIMNRAAMLLGAVASRG